MRLLLLLVVIILANSGLGCKKAVNDVTEKPVIINQEEEEENTTVETTTAIDDTTVENLTTEEAQINPLNVEDDSDDVDDFQEAFSDIEDEGDGVCGERDFTEKTTRKELPSAVIIGTKKGGTRALLEFLNMHPQVRRSKHEPHFYDKNFEKGAEWYKEQMPEILEDQISLEKTPGYFHTAGVPEKIKEIKNDTKLILIVRNPVSRLISDYNQFRSNTIAKNLTYPPLEELVLSESGRILESYPPIKRSKYHLHMQDWLEVFPRSQLLIIDGDSFIHEPWVELGRLERFLDLPHQLSEDNFFFNTTKGFYCGRQVITRPNSEWSCIRTKCLSKSKGRKKPPVSSDLLSKLSDYFIPHNKIFFKMIGKYDFQWK